MNEEHFDSRVRMISQQESSAQFKAADIRTTGGGLSAAELQELHKTDPKKVKRILANRSVSTLIVQSFLAYSVLHAHRPRDRLRCPLLSVERCKIQSKEAAVHC